VTAADDERWLVIDGRRWRRTDPSIPEPLRAELVGELMSARRAVKDGAPDARRRVHDAKVALGERGEPWWDPDRDLHERIEGATRALLRRREGGTACPSEVARIVDGRRWRERMPLVRSVAASMPEVVVLQKGEEVDPATARGPVRLALSPAGANPPARARRTRRG
jgi:hypothetical protein